MKKLLCVFLLSFSGMVMAQTPQSFSYQCSVRDNTGQLITNQTIGVKITILENSSTGNVVYEETHAIPTSTDGKLTLQIGQGSTTVGSNLHNIDWGSDSYFIGVAMDETGGTNYQEVSNSELLSVPYALYAEKSGFDGDSSSVNELQTISLNNNEVILSNNGGSFILPAGFSGDYNDLTNSPQNLSDFNNDLPAGFSGNYNDLTNSPQNLSDFNNDLPSGFSGDYNDLTNSPQNLSDFNNDLPAGFSGDYNDLTNSPQNLSDFNNDLPAGFSGDYNDLTNSPQNLSDFNNDLPEGFSGDYNDLTNSPQNLSDFNNDLPTGFSGDYNDLTNSPQNLSDFNNDLPTGFSGDYNDLTNSPQNLSDFNNDLPAGFSGEYDSLLNSPQNLSDFNNDLGYINSEIDGSIENEIQNLSQVLAEGNDANQVRITNLGEPINGSDAVTKAYVDLLETRLDSLADVIDSLHTTDGVPNGLTVQQRLDFGETPFEIYTSDTTLLDSLYAKKYQGGKIFHLNTTDGSGLIASPFPLSDHNWSNTSNGVTTSATGTAIGTGASNTEAIVNTYATGSYAALACRDFLQGGFNDWYLPSKDELQSFHTNYYMSYVTPAGTDYYWTSTEVDDNNAWTLAFTNGGNSSEVSENKFTSKKVWPVRMFGTSTIFAPSIQERLASGESPFEIYESDYSLLDELYGKMYQGGIIFYLDTITGEGLAAAPANVYDGPWHNQSASISTGATGTGIGTGNANTNAIVTAYGSGSYAAKACYDYENEGYTDWYLPSKDELHLMYTNYFMDILGALPDGHYWSSTEQDAYNVWYEILWQNQPGTQATATKSFGKKARPIRTFNAQGSGNGNGSGWGNTTYPGETVFVQGGTIYIGSPSSYYNYYSDSPLRSITVNSFNISKHEITNDEYVAFLNSQGNQIENQDFWIKMNPSNYGIEIVNGIYQSRQDKGNLPVGSVTWFGARAYCEWVGGRLPTEAEWEYAAKGGQETLNYLYSGSNSYNNVAWSNNFSASTIQPVGTKAPNELGIHDMSGNVEEWCSDWYDNTYYITGPQNNPQGPQSGTEKVIRGGHLTSDYFEYLVYKRDKANTNYTNYRRGFRVVFP